MYSKIKIEALTPALSQNGRGETCLHDTTETTETTETTDIDSLILSTEELKKQFPGDEVIDFQIDQLKHHRGTCKESLQVGDKALTPALSQDGRGSQSAPTLGEGSQAGRTQSAPTVGVR